MKKTLWVFLGLCMLVCLNTQLFAQEEAPVVVRVITTEGNEFIGVVLEENENEVLLRTEQYGELRLSRSAIRQIMVVDEALIRDGVVWFENPQATRYFWAPNGFGLEKGEAYYQNIWVLYNQATFGVSDHFSLSAGMVPLFLLRAGVTPVWLVPKISIPIKEGRSHAAAGAFLGALLGEQETFGIVFGSFTLGNRDSNGTLGMGWGYAGGSWATSPIVNIGFMARTSQRGYFISENYIIPGNTATVVLSGGGRRILGRTGLDFGLFAFLGNGVFALPFLGITAPLGK